VHGRAASFFPHEKPNEGCWMSVSAAKKARAERESACAGHGAPPFRATAQIRQAATAARRRAAPPSPAAPARRSLSSLILSLLACALLTHSVEKKGGEGAHRRAGALLRARYKSRKRPKRLASISWAPGAGRRRGTGVHTREKKETGRRRLGRKKKLLQTPCLVWLWCVVDVFRYRLWVVFCGVGGGGGGGVAGGARAPRRKKTSAQLRQGGDHTPNARATDGVAPRCVVMCTCVCV
jgi:hypothetical protein